ncbi:hypothetical protein Tco_0477574 [Tanacetum coccineum]
MRVLRTRPHVVGEVAIYHGQVILEDTSIEREKLGSDITRQLMKVYMVYDDHFLCSSDREALVSVYNRFPQLMNDLERNHIIFPKVTINTKFLNCLQPEWLKYVTQVRLAKRLIEDSCDDLFDYLLQFEKLVNASRAKKRMFYQRDTVQNNSDVPLTSAMILLAHAITRNFSNPTNNRFRTSSNTKNQAIVQGDRVNIQSKNSVRLTGRNKRRASC